MTGVAHTEWPAKGEVSPLHGTILSALKASKSELPACSAIACDEPSLEPNTMDILLIHKWGNRDPIFFKGITDSTHNKLVPFIQALENAGEDSVEDGTEFVVPPMPYELRQTTFEQFLFSCCHVARDARCGYCGVKIHDLIVEEIEKRGLKTKVMAARVSHVGGHVYAGNLLVYPSGAWYGYVRPEDVPRVFDQHLAQGVLLADKLRGKLGLNKTENAKFAESLLQPK